MRTPAEGSFPPPNAPPPAPSANISTSHTFQQPCSFISRRHDDRAQGEQLSLCRAVRDNRAARRACRGKEEEPHPAHLKGPDRCCRAPARNQVQQPAQRRPPPPE